MSKEFKLPRTLLRLLNLRIHQMRQAFLRLGEALRSLARNIGRMRTCLFPCSVPSSASTEATRIPMPMAVHDSGPDTVHKHTFSTWGTSFPDFSRAVPAGSSFFTYPGSTSSHSEPVQNNIPYEPEEEKVWTPLEPVPRVLELD
jgi:hypothetical protein